MGDERYVKQDYPAMRYYADGRQVIVEDIEAERALEPGWAASPAGPFTEEKPAAAPRASRRRTKE